MKFLTTKDLLPLDAIYLFDWNGLNNVSAPRWKSVLCLICFTISEMANQADHEGWN